MNLNSSFGPQLIESEAQPGERKSVSRKLSRIGVITSVGGCALWFLPGPAFGARDSDFFELGLRKRGFCRRDTFQTNSQRKTFTVDHYHPNRSLAALGVTGCFAPFGPRRNCHRGMSRLTSASLRRPTHPTEHATLAATRLRPASPSAAASRSPEWDIHREESATLRRSAESTKASQCKHDSTPRAVPASPSCMVVPARMARLTPTVHPSTASAASS